MSNNTTPAPALPTRPRASTYCNRPLPALPKVKPINTPRFRSSWHSLSQFPTPPPILLPKEQVNALSLQDHTFLYILSNVDRYPVELLGLLPLHWRRSLLSALPPFRLYQLEKTSIAKGIDTDEIWQGMGQLQDCVWEGYLAKKSQVSATSKCTQETHRQRFVNYMSHLLFNEMNRDYACKRITELLHAIHVDMLDKSVANGLIYGHVNSLFMFQPPYYLIPFRCPNLTERELYWSLYGNKMLPRSLELYMYNIESSPMWNQEVIGQEMMRRLLSSVEFLRLYNHMYKTTQLEEILSAVTHSSNYKEPPSLMGSLKNLEVLRADDRHLSTITPFFSAPNGYSTLTSITISMKPIDYIQVTRHIGPIIKHQLNSLQNLQLKGFSCCISKNIIHMCDYMFFSSLSAFILKPRFHSLTLDGFKDLPWKMLNMLLEANLRTVPSHNQKILLKNLNVTMKGELPFKDDKDLGDDEDDDDDKEENQFCPASGSKCLEHKHIHFRNAQIPVEVLNWFERTNSVCVHTLEFNKVKVDISHLYQHNDCAHNIEFSTGSNGVVYGHFRRKPPPSVTEQHLKVKFLRHRNFECSVFVWENVRTDVNCWLSV